MRSRLKEGSLFSTSLFHVDTIKKRRIAVRWLPLLLLCMPHSQALSNSAPPSKRLPNLLNSRPTLHGSPFRPKVTHALPRRRPTVRPQTTGAKVTRDLPSSLPPTNKATPGPPADTRRNEDANEVPLSLRLCQSLSQWHFVPLRVRHIIGRCLSWTWHRKPPPLQHLLQLRAPAISGPLLLPLAKGVIKEVPSQPCYPSRVFTVPKPSEENTLSSTSHH